MDSISQIALGAAVTIATMSRRTAIWKAALWGAVAGTIPDLDVVIDHGDAVRNMVFHRTESHAPFWLTLLSLPLAAGIARLHGEWAHWRRWWLAIWLALVTHPLLDVMTVYGTQLGLPFTDHPYGVGSIFIIDPLYTVPLLVGAAWALAARGSPSGLRANAIGLVVSTAYLAWSAAAQQHVERLALASLSAQGITAERVLVTPAPLNTVLWRIVAIDGDRFHEGFYSLLDTDARIRFDSFPRGTQLQSELGDLEALRRIAAFSKGFYKLSMVGERATITDLRMGQEPNYTFAFAIAEKRSPWSPVAAPPNVGGRGDTQRGLAWVWRRAWGEPLPPPR